MLDMLVPCSIPTRISRRAVNVFNRGKPSFRNLQPVSRTDEIRTITNRSVKCNITEKSLNHRNLIPVKITDHILKSECAKLASINCQSMNNKSDLLLEYIVEKDLDICFLVETWFKTEYDFALKASVPNGFSYLNKPRPHDIRGGGVATIYRKDIKCKEMQNDTHFKSFEHQIVEAEINATKFIFAVVYRIPPSQSNRIPKRLFISEFAK